jgi:hypothetical protein
VVPGTDLCDEPLSLGDELCDLAVLGIVEGNELARLLALEDVLCGI